MKPLVKKQGSSPLSSTIWTAVGSIRSHVKRLVTQAPMTTFALTIRNAVARIVAVLTFGASLVFGSAGTAHAHGTWTPPVVPSPSRVHTQGPFSVLHQVG